MMMVRVCIVYSHVRTATFEPETSAKHSPTQKRPMNEVEGGIPSLDQMEQAG